MYSALSLMYVAYRGIQRFRNVFFIFYYYYLSYG